MVGLTAVIDRAGTTPIEVTPRANSLRWTSAAVGGFGSCTFDAPGIRGSDLPFLSRLTLYYGSTIVWQGQIEDRRMVLVNGGINGSIQAFGWRRKLDETSVKKLWVKRDFDWQPATAAYGEDTGGSGIAFPFNSIPGCLLTPNELDVSIGEIDASDASRRGIRFRGKASTISTNQGHAVFARIPSPPSGSSLGAFAYTRTAFGNWTSAMGVTPTLASWTWGVKASLNGEGSNPLNADRNTIAFIVTGPPGSSVPAITDYVDITNIRLLLSTTEDATGGYWGGTVLRDLVTLVPGLTLGIIEDGSDFLIEAIERVVRDKAMSVVNEVAGYYAREWAVWEEGRFDWKTRNLDEAQWLLTLQDLAGLELDISIDQLTRTSYVLYSDAASSVDAEASSASTDQRNAYVRTGTAKDDLVSPGFPMTATSAAQLAARLAADKGTYPVVSGRIVLPITAFVNNAVGGRTPAALIRGGENVVIADLPKDDVLSAGRDGQTLFHVVSADTDFRKGRITLELEGQARRSDVLLARLAAATRTVTG